MIVFKESVNLYKFTKVSCRATNKRPVAGNNAIDEFDKIPY